MIRCNHWGVTVRAPDTVVGRGLAATVRKYLDGHCRPPLHFLHRWKVAITLALLAAFAVTGARANELPPHVGFRSLCGLLLIGAGVHLLAHLARRAVIHTVRRNERETWWLRNRDKIVPPTIVGVVVGVLMLLLGLAIGRGQQKAVADPPRPGVAPGSGDPQRPPSRE
jgi:hypothetical protein